MSHCTLCDLSTGKLLGRLRGLQFMDEAELSHALQVALSRRALTQRPGLRLLAAGKSGKQKGDAVSR